MKYIIESTVLKRADRFLAPKGIKFDYVVKSIAQRFDTLEAAKKALGNDEKIIKADE